MNPIVMSLILGTATPGGGFPVHGDAYAEMLNAQEPRLRIVAAAPRADLIHPGVQKYLREAGLLRN